jgi:DNA invertase Pin-like site-specific DNA recombinase
MSTDRQEASISTQREALQKLAAKLGYSIVNEYTDEGISGDDTERRTAFRKMLGDASAGEFDCVLCWDQSRFGRFDPLEAGYWIKPLRDAGAWLETVAEGRIDWSDFAGRIVYAVQQEGKHAFLKDNSRTTARGMLAKAKRGEWLGGVPPFGYRLNAAKRLEPADPIEVEAVRWLFSEYLTTDTSLSALARGLNERGVRTRRRSRNSDGPALWRAATVWFVLTRPTYVGHTVWNRRHVGAYHGIRNGEVTPSTKPRRQIKANDPADWIVFENTHEPLVDQATYDRVQQKLLTRREGASTPHKGGGGFAFTGLLKCGDCGWPMHGTTVYNGPTKAAGGRAARRRYICGKYIDHRRQGCNSNGVNEEVLLDIVLGTLESKFLEPGHLDELKAEIRRQEKAERAGAEPTAADLDRRIAALSRKIDTGMERWLTAPPDMVAEAGAKLEQWRKDRDALAEQRRAVAKPAVSEAALDAAAEEIAQGVAMLRKRAKKAKPAELRAVLKEMVEKIVVTFRQEPFGKRMKSIPVGGTMYLRDRFTVCRPVSIGGPIKKPIGVIT